MPSARHMAPDASPRLRGGPGLVLLLLLLLLLMLVEVCVCALGSRQAGAARCGRGCWCVAVRALSFFHSPSLGPEDHPFRGRSDAMGGHGHLRTAGSHSLPFFSFRAP